MTMLESSTWYLDSGCSRHMTGDSRLLKDLVDHEGPNVSFGDNSKGRVMGKGKIIHGSITIENVLLVESLQYNLISISQLCENDLVVAFHKEVCYVKNEQGVTLLTGT
ncbi:hypothetical protein RF094_08820, partial [Serratia marcescens]|nr:hypothetical protein [Serratia marcescens]